jgi:stage V sporulation protein D (sporulation-specific penicillin-binding protein)
MLARTDSRARALSLLIVATVLATLIGGRLAWWQVAQHGWLSEMALNQLAQNEDLPAERGDIRDATGVLLATSVQVQSVFATPPSVTDKAGEAKVLGPLLGIDTAQLETLLRSSDPWVWLKRRVDRSVSAVVRGLALPGIGLVPETRRVYPIEGTAPGTTLAAQVLGFVNVDGVGQYGVEGASDPLVAGLPGSVTAQADVIGRRIADSVNELRPPVNGSDLTLTLDAGLQFQLEQAMWETYTKNQAQGATGIVMDVKTGAILAMASYPSFDGNQYASSDPSTYTEPAVSRVYEPGSVMKAFTIAAALDAGAINLATTVHDDNNLRIGKYRIQNADRAYHAYGHGDITAGDVLKLSDNVGAAKIGLLLGRQRLYEALRRFGFGTPTGVDIAGESAGVVHDPDGPGGYGDLTAAQNAFGQGLGITAIQLVAGYAAIANGGTLVTPHVIAGWMTPDGVYHEASVDPGERIMQQATAQTVLGLLTAAVDDGIAKPASIPGYSVAGKTGTAQVAGPASVRVQTGTDASGRPIYGTQIRDVYRDGWIDSSFVSVVPASAPRVVTLILIHRPVTWGNLQTAQSVTSVYRDWAPQMLEYLAIPPDRPATPVAAK